MTNRATFLKLLREDILKLDLAELDFGIYRVLNYRRAEIEHFIDEHLITLMSGALRNQSGDRLVTYDGDLRHIAKN
jgi:adenine-specific DNA-methyltransferase